MTGTGHARRVRFGSLRRLRPVSEDWGFDRGRPIDRFYIGRFLEEHSMDISGDVVEIGGDGYSRRYGTDVRSVAVLDRREENLAATFYADLGDPTTVPAGRFDCAVVTQVLQYLREPVKGGASIVRMLRPGGVALCTLPVVSRISRHDADEWGEYWRFTTWSARSIFETAFSPEDVHVRSYGNLLTAVAFLEGLAAEELRPEELAYEDPDFQVLVGVRAVKAG